MRVSCLYIKNTQDMMKRFCLFAVCACLLADIIRKSKFPWFPERSVQFSGKRTKRSVQKKRLHTTLIKPEQKVNEDLCSGFIVS